MNQPRDIEARLEELGSRLRLRPTLADGVMNLLRKESAAPEGAPRAIVPRPKHFWRRYRALVLLLGATAAALPIALLVFPITPQVSLAQVTEKLRAQKWIHAVEKGDRPGLMEMWLSPEHEISAMKLFSTVRFANGKERAKYEYTGLGRPEIWKFPLGDKLERETVPWNAVSQGRDGIGPWLFGNEEILRQDRKEVMENGKRFLEYDLQMRGERTIVLRVDPQTRLPVYLTMPPLETGGALRRWDFEYPEDGPRDIYALGVARETPVNDLMPQPEFAKLLDGMAESRRAIGNFRMTVTAQLGRRSSVVWRKGDRWRVDSCVGDLLDGPQPAGKAWDAWWNELLAKGEAFPVYVCDGKNVMVNRSFGGPEDRKKWKWEPENSFGPQELMDSSAGNLGNENFVRTAFPDMAPRPHDPCEFVKEPADGPPGSVLIKRSALLTDGREWHSRSYLDPQKGYARLKQIQFGLKPEERTITPERAENYTLVFLEDYQRSPQGFWYPGNVRVVRFARKDGEAPDAKPVQISEEVRHYEFNFEAELPESLFSIADGK